MVNMFALSAVNHRFESRWGQTKNYKIGMSCFYANYTAISSKSKILLTQNQENMSELSDMSARRLLIQWTTTIQIQLSVLI